MLRRVPALFLCLSAACSGEKRATPADAAKARAQPDILLVSIDSLRADHLGCYGYEKPTSPVIDRLAREGVRFSTAVSTTSWTLPAHAAMFTGLYDSTHGVIDNGLALPPAARTLAEELRSAGYRTAGFFGGPYLHPVFGLSQGFDVYESCMSASRGASSETELKHVLDPDDKTSHGDVTGPRTLEAVERLLSKEDPARPLFAFVHLWDVHYDYQPPENYWRRFDPDYSGALDARDLAHNKAIHEGMPARDLQHLIALYDGEIAFTDEILGRMLEAWGRRRDLANTVVVVTADHGEEFFEHRGKGHQKTLFDEVIRVPLVVWWPKGLPAARVVDVQARLIDLFPTLTALARVENAPRVQGRDLGPLLRGEALPPATALCELYTEKQETRALRSETLKVLQLQGGKEYFALDLARDPRERGPLPLTAPEVERGLAALESELEAARAFGRSLAAPPRKITIEDALKRALKGFGYVGDDEDEETPR